MTFSLKKLYTLKKSTNFLWITLLLFVLILPVSSFLSTRILFLLLILSIMIGEQKLRFSDLLRSSWDCFLYLLVLGIGIIYSSDKQTAWRALETSFSLLALPIISQRFKDFSRDRVNTIFLVFSLGIFAAGLLCLINAIVVYLTIGHNSQVFFYYDFTEIIGSHPTYLAYYLIFAITYGLYAINYEKVRVPIWVILFLILFCFSILLLTGGQTAFASLLFVFSFFILKYLLGGKANLNKISIGLVGFMLVTILYVNSGAPSERDHLLSDSWDRFELWQSGIFANSNFLLGVGTGDYKLVLNEYFRKNGQELYAQESLNSHNQFIQIFFSNGFLGLIAISLLILRPLYMAFRNNDQMGILMIFPFLIYGMTEVFLGRYQGVVFFALLHQVLVLFYLYSTATIQAKRL